MSPRHIYLAVNAVPVRDAKLNRLRTESVHAVKDPWTCVRGLDAMLAAMG